MLPPFTSEGLLPPGDYELGFEELRQSLLVAGPGGCRPTWDSRWRRRLVDNLEILVRQLWQVGVMEIFAGGSFAGEVDRPRDIDVYFDCDEEEYLSGSLEYRLNLVAPNPIWNWDTRARKLDDRGVWQPPMWHKYRIDLYPNFGQIARIRHGHPVTFPTLLRWTTDGKPRGILKIRDGCKPLDSAPFAFMVDVGIGR